MPVDKVGPSTWILVHGEVTVQASGLEETIVPYKMGHLWEFKRTEGVETQRVIGNAPFLDALIVFADEDPEPAWCAVRRFIERFPDAPVLVICFHASVEDRALALARRVVDIQPLTNLETGLVHYWLKHSLHAGSYHRALNIALDAGMSPRQYQCMLLTAEGLPGKEIAEKLGIDAETVHHHLKGATKKSGASDRKELIDRIRRESRIEAFKTPFLHHGKHTATDPTTVWRRNRDGDDDEDDSGGGDLEQH